MNEDVTLDEFTESDNKEPSERENNSLRQEGFLTLPHDWNVSTVDEVSKDGGLVDGDWIESDDMDENGEVQLVQLGHIGEGQFEGKPDRFITKEFAEKEDCAMLSKGDLLISRMQEPILRSCLLPSFELDSVMAVDIARLQENKNWNRMLVKYLFNSRPIWRQGIAWASGTTRKRISRKNIEKLRLPTPPLSEQRKIATVLHTVDRAIQKAEEIIERQKKVQQGVEQQVFQQGYFDHNRIEKDRSVTIPSDWNFDQLSEHTIDSAFGPRFGSEKYSDDGNIASLRTTDLNDRGRITLETMPLANLERSDIEEHILKPSDFIITRSGTTGIGAVWEGYDKPTIPGAFLIRFRFKDTLDPYFAKYYVNSSIGRSRVNRRAKGGVQKNLAGSDLLNMRFPIPSENEQRKIVEIFDSIEQRIMFERRYISELESIKQGLMQDLLSGEVRTTDADMDIPEEIAKYG